MGYQDIPRKKMEEPSATSEDIAELKALMRKMQLKIDVLEETIKVIKKDHGADLKTLKNKEKATIIDALKNEYSLPELLDVMDVAIITPAIKIPTDFYIFLQNIKSG